MREDGMLQVAEWGIILPLTLFIFLGCIVMSLGVWSKIVISDAAREAARYEALGLGTADEKVEEVIRGGGLKPERIEDVEVEEEDNFVTVTVCYKQPVILRFLPALVGGEPWSDEIIIRSTSVFKVETI